MLCSMFDVAESLTPALRNAQSQLDTAAATVAQVNAHGGNTEEAMTATAQAALFSEALLGAVHARLAELKAAAKP